MYFYFNLFSSSVFFYCLMFFSKGVKVSHQMSFSFHNTFCKLCYKLLTFKTSFFFFFCFYSCFRAIRQLSSNCSIFKIAFVVAQFNTLVVIKLPFPYKNKLAFRVFITNCAGNFAALLFRNFPLIFP